MAQRDIQSIADFMREEDAAIAEEDLAYEKACAEQEEDQQLEDDQLEDEVIDRASMGFIDSDDNDGGCCDEEEQSIDDELDEDIGYAMQGEIPGDEPVCTLQLDVYNEDGYGKYFAQRLAREVPDVDAAVKKTLPNGDIAVEVAGTREALERAFAFYLGKKEYAKLPQEDKEEFESLLTFNDGDTLAEADYREKVAHCLDPIGVHASTASLADQDTCALSIVKEEKARRLAKKAVKALQEDDFSSLSDEELDALDKMEDKAQNDEEFDAMQDKVWAEMTKAMGYTPEEWDKLPEEQRKKIWNFHNATLSGKGSLGDGTLTGYDPKTNTKFRYRNSYEVTDPTTGEKYVTQVNPEYDQEHSIAQHPAMARRQAKKDAKEREQASKEQIAKDTMKKVRGRRGTWDKVEFAKMVSALDNKQRKELMNELLADIEAENKDDPRKAGNEAMFIKSIFGKKLTLRDLAKAWGKSAPGVMKFADDTIAIWKKTLRDMGIKNQSELFTDKSKFNQFKEQLKQNMDSRHKGSIVSGR